MHHTTPQTARNPAGVTFDQDSKSDVDNNRAFLPNRVQGKPKTAHSEQPLRSAVLRKSPGIALALFAATMTGTPAHADTGAIYNLGTLGGGVNKGLSLNAAGQVVGYSDAPQSEHAFLYSGVFGNNGTMLDLGTLPGGTFSEADGINAGGQITGDSDAHTINSERYHAFLYSGTPGSGGSMVDLGTLGGANSQGNAINSSGQITGYSNPATGTGMHAFLYSGVPGSGGHMVDLGTLGGTESRGYAINDSGQIAGYSSLANGTTYHALLYTGVPGNGGKMNDLGTLGGTSSFGRAINANGRVVGESNITGDAATHAFLYSGTPGVDGQMFNLGTLGGTNSYAEGINGNDQVVGGSNIGTTTHAFLYVGAPQNGGTMIDLDAWLDTVNPTEGAKWTLNYALAITDSGLITGYGNYNDGPNGLSDGQRPFLLDASALIGVPEPASLALFAAGAFLLLRRRNRQFGNA